VLLQIPLLNQLAQMQLDGVAIGGQKSYCIGKRGGEEVAIPNQAAAAVSANAPLLRPYDVGR